MQIDFIHIGYHKTASTFLQSRVYPKIDNLLVLNHINEKTDQWFYKHFVQVNAHQFDKKNFLKNFTNIILASGVKLEDKILAISEENLSGDIYTGLESRELMLRLFDVFGPVKILIVIRNQIDYLLSAYGNYVVHGGTKRFSSWFYGEETRFKRIANKLIYSALILDYMATFGERNVTVLQYERLFDRNEGISTFFNKFDLKFPENIKGSTNLGRSLRGNNILSLLNTLGLSRFYGRQITTLFFKKSPADRKNVMEIIKEEFPLFLEDNKTLENLLGIQFGPLYFNC